LFKNCWEESCLQSNSGAAFIMLSSSISIKPDGDKFAGARNRFHSRAGPVKRSS
jgi:hypothetical protein